MEIESIIVFAEAARTGSLASTARKLGLGPMAASRRLAALEAELGVRLVHRTTRALSLTVEGEAFLPHAEAMVEAALRHVKLLEAAHFDDIVISLKASDVRLTVDAYRR